MAGGTDSGRSRSERGTSGARRVWLLGNAHPSADRSIHWDDDPFPNLSDPDALVVDLTTLTGPVLERIGKAKLDRVQPLVRDKIINRGTVVVITKPFFPVVAGRALTEDTSSTPSEPYMQSPAAYSNYQILPIRLTTRDVPAGGVIEVDPEHTFKEYADNVRRFSFYIEGYSPRAIMDTEMNSSVKIELAPVQGQEIKDNSGHDLGLTLTAEVVDHYNYTTSPHEGAGFLEASAKLTPKNRILGRADLWTRPGRYGWDTEAIAHPTSYAIWSRLHFMLCLILAPHPLHVFLDCKPFGHFDPLAARTAFVPPVDGILLAAL